MNNHPEKTMRADKVENFVDFIIARIAKDKGAAAALRRADNLATEYQSWEQLAAFHIDLDKDYERLPYATIAAAVAKAKATRNGNLGIGAAIANCYEDGSNSDQAKAKLRRLLACNSVQEACRILRPIFALLQSRNVGNLDFAGLLTDLLRFHGDEQRQRIKARWAQGFYHPVVQAENEEEEL